MSAIGRMRGWIIFAQVIGTVVALLGLGVYIYYLQDINNSLDMSEVESKALTSLLLAVISYFTWRTVYTAIVIIQFVRKASDSELDANRYIISALSLTVAGFFTPFIMTSMPNTTSVSTVSARWFLSKTLGVAAAIGMPIAALAYFGSLATGSFKVTDTGTMFASGTTMGTISIVVIALTAAGFALGLITTMLFNNQKAKEAFANAEQGAGLQIISQLWMAILTVELVVVMLMAVLRLVGAFAELLRAREGGVLGAVMIVFAILNLILTFIYVMMLLYICARTIAGMWRRDGMVTINEYRPVENFKANQQQMQN